MTTTQIGNQYIKGFSGLTYSDIQALTGLTLSAGEQTLAALLIESAEFYFCKSTNRNYLTTVDYTDVRDAGYKKYHTSNFPIKEIVKIQLDGVTLYEKGGTSNTLVLNTDFWVFDDHIIFDQIPYSVTNNYNALVFTYNIYACFNTDAKLALLQWVSDLFLNRETAGKSTTSFSSSGISENFANNIPDYVTKIINLYKKYEI